MPYFRKKLFFLIAVQILLSILDRHYAPLPSSELWYMNAGIFYWIGIAWMAYLGIFIMTLRCSSCNKPKIYRGKSMLDLRLPDSKCWSCSEQLQ